MTVTADLSGVRQTRWHELLLRFATGGLITVAAGLVAQRFGPVIGGLFLAFPAIFPASATLIAKHEHEKKMAKGLAGRRRGIEAAAVDACGTALGSIGLVAFAGTSWWLLRAHAPYWRWLQRWPHGLRRRFLPGGCTEGATSGDELIPTSFAAPAGRPARCTRVALSVRRRSRAFSAHYFAHQEDDGNAGKAGDREVPENVHVRPRRGLLVE